MKRLPAHLRGASRELERATSHLLTALFEVKYSPAYMQEKQIEHIIRLVQEARRHVEEAGA